MMLPRLLQMPVAQSIGEINSKWTKGWLAESKGAPPDAEPPYNVMIKC